MVMVDGRVVVVVWCTTFETVLIEIFTGTLQGVIKSMLMQHLVELRDSTDKDPERLIHSQQLYTALAEFLDENGVSIGIARGGASLNGKSWRMRNIKTSESGAARYKGRKVHTHKGHHFVVTTYGHPTWCGHCGNMLWGLMKQGWKCVDCGYDVHKAKDRTGYVPHPSTNTCLTDTALTLAWAPVAAPYHLSHLRNGVVRVSLAS
jgi:hypothetical protein